MILDIEPSLYIEINYILFSNMTTNIYTQYHTHTYACIYALSHGYVYVDVLLHVVPIQVRDHSNNTISFVPKTSQDFL